jgi:transposase InsO family protein
LYRLDPMGSNALHSAMVSHTTSGTEQDKLMLWHRKLGHSNVRRIIQLFSKDMTADGQELPTRVRPDAHRLHTGEMTASSQEPQPLTRPDAHPLHSGKQGRTTDGQELQLRVRRDAQRLHPLEMMADSHEPQIHRPSAHRLHNFAHRLQQDRHCDSCAICKHHAAITPPSVPAESRAQRPLETIHIDLRGPYTPGVKGELYQLLIIDECTHYAVGSTLLHKSDAFSSFERFATAANNFHHAKGYSIQFIRSDNGGEFIGAEWTPLLIRLGMQRQRTSPYTPHQNGIVERLNRTIAESTRTMLHAAGLPERFWSLACQTAVYVHNRLPNKAIGNTTPYQLWNNRRPSVGNLHTFGCLAYALVHTAGKLDDRARRCTFVGYPLDSSRTYLLWDNQQQKLLRSGHVRFIENIMGFNYKPSSTVGEAAAGEAAAGEELVRRATIASADNASHSSDAALTPAATQSAIPGPEQPINDISPIPAPPLLNRSQQAQLRNLRDTLPAAVNDLAPAVQVTDTMLSSDRPQLRAGTARHHYYGSIHAAALDDMFDSTSEEAEEPGSFQAAIMRSAYRDQWLAAIRSELRSLIKAGTWRYAQKPSTANLVGCRWLFKMKRDKDGNVSKFKARLVAQGFTQVFGVDYAETYAPVARYTSIRLIIALAAHYDWELHQLDVKTAYLNGDLDVPIYMQSPEGLALINESCPADSACLLLKSLYGLKQSGRRWNVKINQSLIQIGFTPLHADRCVYVRRKADVIIIIALYVDDLLIASSRKPEMASIKRMLTQMYEMEDMGEATFILGIDIRRERANRSISIGQSAYVHTLLKRHGMADCNSTSTPMETAAAHDLMAAADSYQASLTLTRDYQSIIGGLMFAATCTRPDIAFAVNRLSRYCANPTEAHYAAAKRVLRYLAGTVNHYLTYIGTAEPHPQLVGYSDADWAQDADDKRRSTSGYVFLMCGAAISWQSKKQSTIALSTTEAELMAITSSMKELLWFRTQLGGLHLDSTQPTTLLVDSQCAIDIANNSKISDRSKHIDVKHFFIREHIEAGTVKLQHIPSAEQAADTLTKPLHRVAFKHCAALIGLHSQLEPKAKRRKVVKQPVRRGEVLENNGAQPAALQSERS